jgi:imidazolonepropionase
MSTVNATRDANFGELLSQTKRRLDVLQAEGCGTVEIKSGYGLNLATELTMLEVVRELGNRAEISVVSTFLGAHTVPIEFKNDRDGHIDLVCNEMLPAVHEKKLADAVDAFCETIAFPTAQLARVFSKAQDLSLPVKLHADQLSDGGGAALAAEFNATSADHLEYTSAAGVSALADAGTVAVMLPGAFLTLGETQLPPIEQFRDHNVPIAIATDCNPGSSPICSLRTTMALATSLFKLTPEECLAGVTRNAATALGLGSDRGTLEIGKRADLAIWDINHPQVLSYWIGSNELSELLVAGMPV